MWVLTCFASSSSLCLYMWPMTIMSLYLCPWLEQQETPFFSAIFTDGRDPGVGVGRFGYFPVCRSDVVYTNKEQIRYRYTPPHSVINGWVVLHWCTNYAETGVGVPIMLKPTPATNENLYFFLIFFFESDSGVNCLISLISFGSLPQHPTS